MAERREPLNPTASGTEEQSETLWTQFTQQRLKAWQPILTPQRAIALYALGGLAFLGLGVALLLLSWSVEEYSVDYTPLDLNEHEVGQFDVQIKRDMEPPIWIYYELSGFHQNHRRYVKSRDDNQLAGTHGVQFQEQELADCIPWVAHDDGRVFYPCGLVAHSVFNDTFAFQVRGPAEGDDNWELLAVDSDAKTIAWAADIDKFANLNPHAEHENVQHQALLDMWILRRFPPAECKQETIDEQNPFIPVYPAMTKVVVEEKDADSAKAIRAGSFEVVDCKGYAKDATPSCRWESALGEEIKCEGAYKEIPVADWGLQSGHFIVWMRVAGLPTFRKLWGRVDRPLKAGSTVRVHVASNFPVKQFGGGKGLVISTSSALGGRNDFLGLGYLAVGVACLGFGTWFLWCHLARKPSQLQLI